ncbi:toll/interleukin-1 receptor domain-containing protein [Roseibacterium beibuensis]|uniref:TIR domain-containing protein n=1 Tax=[Roseibacterium] beibuensis TaxID=1193142 RepID=A0ABP9LIL9_9RHOB|nr:toll/interleukin-1 receptor domain-containing protein [Roseibacterium beibuensis]MCS6623643.1 toll/interleukin-1 receptor domain-containing protein [Roseibacterium beibuensis]
MSSIFLSHNHNDKPIVEPIALRLAEIFGQRNVFYDSWSIQPGDGIIDAMNKGLSAPDLVFYFVSEHSLKSKMVELEWQNALFKASQGKCKVIPVRIDDSSMPAVLTQNLYIDLFSNGLEAAILQIVNVAQGNSSFTPQHLGFSNISYEIIKISSNETDIFVRASHYLEPHPHFVILTKDTEQEISASLPDLGMARQGFNKDIKLNDGMTYNGIFIASIGGSITPKMPLRIRIKWAENSLHSFEGILHQKGADEWRTLPNIQA